MNISHDRKMLNKNNLIIDDPHDKVFATSAQKKRCAKRGKKTLKRFWMDEVQTILNEEASE
jgi:hypothetical protein